MKFKFLSILIVFSILGAAFMQNSATQSFIITSGSFSNGQTLPNEQIHGNFGCTGKNISPDLQWNGAPKDTKSFALIVHDPDAPRPNGWYHWIVLNIPANTKGFKQGQKIHPPMVEAKNDFGSTQYGGACPPKGHGLHHYNFTIYALDTPTLVITGASTPNSLERLVKQRALASTTITATYGRE